MADVENPEAAYAEPDECSRRIFACVVGFLYIALIGVSAHTMELQEAHPESTGAAVIAMGFLAFLFGLCFNLVFVILVVECFRGDPTGRLFVDDLLQSDRFILREAAHQFMRRMDQHPVYQDGDA